jgi:hypothetical protein
VSVLVNVKARREKFARRKGIIGMGHHVLNDKSPKQLLQWTKKDMGSILIAVHVRRLDGSTA